MTKFILIKTTHNTNIMVNVDSIESILDQKDRITMVLNTRNDDNNEQAFYDFKYNFKTLVYEINNMCLNNIAFLDTTIERK